MEAISSTNNNATTKIKVQSRFSKDVVLVEDPRKKYQCHVCKKKFLRFKTLRKHFKIHTDERPYKCEHCDKGFRQKLTLTNHVRIHTGEKPFTCNICGKDFRQQGNLITHIKTHKESSIPTSLLNYQPQQQSINKRDRKAQNHLQNASYRQHNQQRIPISKNFYYGTYNSPETEELVKPYQCNVCKCRFTLLNTLRNHARTHIHPKPFKCETCDESFSQSATLTKKIHMGDKPYPFCYCHMQFRQQSTLSNHLRTHTHAALPTPVDRTSGAHLTSQPGFQKSISTWPNNIQIDHIDSTTTDIPVVATAANSNVVTPSGRISQLSASSTSTKGECPDRPFGCGICWRFFSQRTTLVNHIKTHTGEKPYKCKVCKADFRQMTTMNNHMRIHTGEKPYSCSYCSKKFRQRSGLQNHLRLHAS